MNTALNTTDQDIFPLSLRVLRLVLGSLLVVALLTELSLSGLWQLGLATLALYTLITGVFGRDPVFKVLKLSPLQFADYSLNVVAQLECLTVGLICIAAGVMNRGTDSLILLSLPFVGVYPILLCAVRHDLLGYLLQSYRKNI